MYPIVLITHKHKLSAARTPYSPAGSAKILMQLQRMSSAVSRVMELHHLLQQPMPTGQGSAFLEGPDLRFDGVTVVTPTTHILVHDLSFSVQPGGALLLTGHNGAGKSSIFRCCV